jgi:hypothetical protein
MKNGTDHISNVTVRLLSFITDDKIVKKSITFYPQFVIIK